MIYVKINETLYQARIDGKVSDRDWNNRESKSITLDMSYSEVVNLFHDNTPWSIVQIQNVSSLNENGEQVTKEETDEWDNSEYCIAGAITDNRNGTCTIKMGKPTELEVLRSSGSQQNVIDSIIAEVQND